MAIKHLKPRSLSKKELEDYKNSYLTEDEGKFIEDMSLKLSSAIEIYLPVKQCKELYDLAVNRKYKIKAKFYDLDDYRGNYIDDDEVYEKMYKKHIKPWLEKGWEDWWIEDNYGQIEHILVKAPLIIKEDAMGGVSSPGATLYNVPGMGNVVPPSAATGFKGSGDNWGNTISGKLYTQKGPYIQKTAKKKKKIIKKRVKKVKESLKEGNANPYDKIAVMMAKRMRVKLPFKKKRDPKNQNAMIQRKFEHEITPFDEFKKISE